MVPISSPDQILPGPVLVIASWRDVFEMYTIACQFGDGDPLGIAEANNLPVDPMLYVGQPLNIP